jgi:hypothetical protein
MDIGARRDRPLTLCVSHAGETKGAGAGYLRRDGCRSTTMKELLIAACAALALSACASGYGGYGSLGYSAYYDDAYGPYRDGYWGRDGAYWYSTGPRGPYRRDDGHHFRRDPYNGFHGVHGRHWRPHRH